MTWYGDRDSTWAPGNSEDLAARVTREARERADAHPLCAPCGFDGRTTIAVTTVDGVAMCQGHAAAAA